MSEATDTMIDDRIVRETGIDARIASIIQPALKGAGFRLVRVRLLGQQGLTLQVMAEDPATGQMTLDQCATLSRALSDMLDAEDPIDSEYR